jgi:hypothetical protein
MLAGRISPGNAQPLSSFLREGDWSSLRRWLSDRVTAARRDGCHSLLLSNERILGGLACPGHLSHFQEAAWDVGIVETRFALVLRDPVEQALRLGEGF